MSDSHPARWTYDRESKPAQGIDGRGLSISQAMWRGVRARCPVCGGGHLFAGWLRVRATCEVCAAPLGLINADDAPPYFTVFIVAHVAIGALVAMERRVLLPVATELLIFLPATLALVLVLIRPVKGATVGLMLKLGFMKPVELDSADPSAPDLPRHV